MFEDKVIEILKKLNPNEEDLEIFYKLTHKKHCREIYFKNSNTGINFIKSKFNSPIKKVVYFFIKLELLQPFLKKIKLPVLGDVIYIGEQIKVFNLKNKIVYSFPGPYQKKDNFLKSKKEQKKLGEEGLAPKVLEINEEIPFSIEELINGEYCKEPIKIFKKMYSFYRREGIDKISAKEYLEKIKNKVSLNKVNKNEELYKILCSMLNKKECLLITTLHGDFAKENTLIDKKGNVFFIDWNLQKDLIIGDLVNFFRNEENLLENIEFLKILKLYPSEIQRNIREYLIIYEISSILLNRRNINLSKRRLKNLLKMDDGYLKRVKEVGSLF